MSLFTFPIWLLLRSLSLMINPIGTLIHVRDGVVEKFLLISKGLLERISSTLCKKLKCQQLLVKRIAWGIFWSVYVLLIILGLLVMAIIAGSMTMQKVVEEPAMVKDLSFDYMKASPDAFARLGKPDSDPFGLDVGKYGVWHFSLLNRELKLAVSLTLPESDYNWKLGLFQVKVRVFLQGRPSHGQCKSSIACFASKAHQFVIWELSLKVAVYLAGYYCLESQTHSLEMPAFTELTEPTACIRIVLEQRAEYKAGAGIPEIYAASFKLESELPIFKRAIWNWKSTFLIWVSLGFFM